MKARLLQGGQQGHTAGAGSARPGAHRVQQEAQAVLAQLQQHHLRPHRLNKLPHGVDRLARHVRDAQHVHPRSSACSQIRQSLRHLWPSAACFRHPAKDSMRSAALDYLGWGMHQHNGKNRSTIMGICCERGGRIDVAVSVQPCEVPTWGFGVLDLQDGGVAPQRRTQLWRSTWQCCASICQRRGFCQGRSGCSKRQIFSACERVTWQASLQVQYIAGLT